MFSARWFVQMRASRRAGRDICGEVLAAEPTAIVCFNDLLALGMMMELKRRGIDPGRDISLTGYDDIDEALARVEAARSAAQSASRARAIRAP